MALSQATLAQIHSILTSERMTYKGSEILALFGVLAEVNQEQSRLQAVQDKQTLQSRIVPNPAAPPQTEAPPPAESPPKVEG